ncbi:MAG TPA: hypothetical protein VFP89_11000 [Propionibacteriaceae bacterium]|nr:hypothetical protein [Propionibacteriaceae bacterium]
MVQTKIAAAVSRYETALAQQRVCLGVNLPLTQAGDASSFCPAPTKPDFGDAAQLATSDTANPVDDMPANAPAVPVITPEQAAYMAVAQLQLPTLAPEVGPSPDLNEWNMAVVGYPLWLWVDGPARIGPVSQAVANLSVSLDAKVSKVVYRMGDGNSVTCNGPGTKWTKSVPAGRKSPDCGYTYTEPSLPKGNYTVTSTTYWDVGWSINGSTGVISMPLTASTEIPVGELQVLVTR